jgi:hypothetical protein
MAKKRSPSLSSSSNSSSEDDEEEARPSPSRSKNRNSSLAYSSPQSSSSVDDRFWGVLKKFMFFGGILTFFLNLQGIKTLSSQFAIDYEADLAEFAKPL